MTRLPHAHIDPEGLQEFSVVFTDRSLNHMSARFQQVMRDVSSLLREVYRGSAVALVPGGGTYAMEAVARQFGQGNVLVVRFDEGLGGVISLEFHCVVGKFLAYRLSSRCKATLSRSKRCS